MRFGHRKPSWGCLFLSTFDLEREVHISARRMAVRTNLFVRIFLQGDGFVLRQRCNSDMHLDRDAETTPLARPYGSVTGDDSSLDVLLMLPRHELDRSTEASGVPGCKQVLRRRGVRQSGSTHFLPHRQIDADGEIGGL